MNQGNRLFIIGCGLPQTGTLATKSALEALLGWKCYHVINACDHQEELIRFISGEANSEEYQSFLNNNKYTAVVDLPFCFLYEKLLKKVINAKVILTVTDPKKWVKSIKLVISEVVEGPPILVRFFGSFKIFQRHLMYTPLLHSALGEHKRFKKLISKVESGEGESYCKKWASHVGEKVPKDRLLIFNVDDGWGPLCKFLGTEVPNKPFPDTNHHEKSMTDKQLQKRRACILLYEFLTLPLLSVWLYCLTRIME